jgi:hypothetical protein
LQTVGRNIVRVLVIVAVASFIVLPVRSAHAAPGPLTITPIGWNIVGLDSNDVTSGPNVFPVGSRVCNTGSNAVTNLSVSWAFTNANALINLTGASTFTESSLGAGVCKDYYFNVQITRSAAAYDTARRFVITASGDLVASVSTPTPREIYVEHLVSQNRNAVLGWTLTNGSGCNAATNTVTVGATCTATITSKTATGGYEQLVTAYYFDNSLFRIRTLQSTYSVPAAYNNTQMYADACGWDNVPTSGTYRSCIGPNLIGAGKAGGNPISTTVTFDVVGTGSQTFTGVIYDFSGSSYHYNSDYATGVNAMTVAAVSANTAPTAADDTDSTVVNTPVTVDVLANDTDPDDGLDTSSVSITGAAGHGTASPNPDGTVTYTPTAGYSGADAFTYQVCDLGGLCDTATVSITVAANQPPTAVNDTATTNEDTPVTIDVLANDADTDDGLDTSSVSVTGAAAHGTANASPDGTIDYTPDPDYNGADSFTYQVCDVGGLCDTATVAVTVNAVNDPPVASDDTGLVNEDASTTIDVVANDTDPDNALDPSSVSVTSGPSHGAASENPDGTIDYTPDPDYDGLDSFDYQVCDIGGLCDTATVTITVSAVNDAPVAADDGATTTVDQPVDIDVVTNDTDVDGDTLSVTGVTQGAHGGVTINPDGTVRYTPDPGSSGSDSFTYTVCDPSAACDTATVDVTITNTNLPPTANDDTAAGAWGVPIAIDELANDSDADGTLDPTTVSVTGNPGHGTVTLQPDGSFSYVADDGYVGADSFDYQVCDDGSPLLCDTATVSITVSANLGPDAQDDTATLTEDTSTTIDVLANDSDPEAGALTVTVAGPAGHGTVTINGAGTIDYTLDPDYDGPDSFTYTVCDPSDNCSMATVTVTVTAVNDAPVANDDSTTVQAGHASPVAVLANDSDPDGTLDPASVVVLSAPSHGSTTVKTTGTIRYAADAGYDGPDTFTYQVCDDQGACATATVHIDVWKATPNRAPIAAHDAVSTPEDTPVGIDVRNNDSDPDGDALTISSFGQSRHGTVARKNGNLEFSPDHNWHGTTTFRYVVCDPSGACDDATVTVVVTSTVDAPLARDDAVTVDSGDSIVILVKANDENIDGHALRVSLTSFPAHGTVVLNAGGTIEYRANAGYEGPDTFRYKVCDQDGDCSPATVHVQVLAATSLVAPGTAHTGADVIDLLARSLGLFVLGILLLRRRRPALG